MTTESQGLQDAVVEAENALAALLVTRRANRLVMTKLEFRKFNDETRQEQIDIQKEVARTTKQLQSHLNAGREDVAQQVISVGTLYEGNRAEGVSTDG